MLVLNYVDRVKLRALVSHFNLDRVLDWVFEHNESRNLPYHNGYHALRMMLDCHEGAVFDSLPYAEERTLLIGALFHDINHSGGALPDDKNIEIALSYLLLAHKEGVITSEDWATVYGLIEATQYPYTTIECTTRGQRIIRDADFNSLSHDTWFEHVVCGLHAEFSVKMDPPSLDQYPELFDAFYSKHIPTSAWGIAKHGKFLSLISKRVEELSAVRDAVMAKYGECTLPTMVEEYESRCALRSGANA